jgi:hypothetical protein
MGRAIRHDRVSANKYLSWLLAATWVASSAGCSVDSSRVAPYSADAADVAGEGTTYPPENCRWLGYGIGPPGQGQCDTNSHLLAHGARQCLGIGGEPIDSRNVSGSCAMGNEEAQLLCCFAGGIPPLDATPTELERHAVPAGVSATRGDLIAGAVAQCGGALLGDWSVIYQQDGVSAAFLWFSCR